MPRMHYDTTSTAVTAWCECGWRDLSLTPTGARALAIDHEQRVHPEDMSVREAARVRTARANRDSAAGGPP